MRYLSAESPKLLGKFLHGDHVTIDIYELSTDTKVVDASPCTEVATTGFYYYVSALAPAAFEMYLWIMTNGDTSEDVYGTLDLDGYPKLINDNIGTPVALDSGTASFAGMLTKMADDNGGSTFNAETDSLNKVRSAVWDEVITAGHSIDGTLAKLYCDNAAWTVISSSNTEANPGMLVSGTFADTAAAGGAAYVTAPIAITGLDVYLTFSIGTIKRPNVVTIVGKYTSASTNYVDVKAYNYDTASWDVISIDGTRMVNSATYKNYQYPLSGHHYDTSGNLRIGFVSADVDTSYRLSIDQCWVAVTGADATTIEIVKSIDLLDPTVALSATSVGVVADAVWDEVITSGHPGVGTAAIEMTLIEAAVGTPVALDGGTASISGMLKKMADDNGGADFNAGTDSLKIISDNADAIKLQTDKMAFTVTNKIDSNVYTWNGTAVASPDTAGYPVVTIKDGTGAGEINTSGGKVPATIAAGDMATDSMTAVALSTTAVAEIADAVWDEPVTSHTAVDTYGRYIDTELTSVITGVLYGTGSLACTYTLTLSDNGTPISGARVLASTDGSHVNIVASGITNQYGIVPFNLDAGNIYLWRYKSGVNFSNPVVAAFSDLTLNAVGTGTLVDTETSGRIRNASFVGSS